MIDYGAVPNLDPKTYPGVWVHALVLSATTVPFDKDESRGHVAVLMKSQGGQVNVYSSCHTPIGMNSTSGLFAVNVVLNKNEKSAFEIIGRRTKPGSSSAYEGHAIRKITEKDLWHGRRDLIATPGGFIGQNRVAQLDLRNTNPGSSAATYDITAGDAGESVYGRTPANTK
jgi:hypothetical protein